MKKQQTNQSKVKETTTDSKKTKELTPKEEVKYKTWLHTSNPFIFNKIYGGKK